MRRGARNHSIKSLERSREMRSNMGASERVLWKAIRKDRLGFRFRRQVRFGPYFLDFYCGEARLCIEVDGEAHGQRQERDERRDAFLRESGIETLRIPSWDLFGFGRGQEFWLTEIERLCRERTRPDLHP